MKWQTYKEVDAAARKSTPAAVACSLKHWRQLRDASERDSWRAFQSKRVSVAESRCALCQRFNGSGVGVGAKCWGKGRKCPLSTTAPTCCGPYNKAVGAIKKWQEIDPLCTKARYIRNKDKHRAFAAAAGRLCERLEKVLAREKAKVKK